MSFCDRCMITCSFCVGSFQDWTPDSSKIYEILVGRRLGRIVNYRNVSHACLNSEFESFDRKDATGDCVIYYYGTKTQELSFCVSFENGSLFHLRNWWNNYLLLHLCNSLLHLMYIVSFCPRITWLNGSHLAPRNSCPVLKISWYFVYHLNSATPICK